MWENKTPQGGKAAPLFYEWLSSWFGILSIVLGINSGEKYKKIQGRIQRRQGAKTFGLLWAKSEGGVSIWAVPSLSSKASSLVLERKKSVSVHVGPKRSIESNWIGLHWEPG